MHEDGYASEWEDDSGSWSIEDEFTDESPAEDFSAFLGSLDEEMSKDIGFAGKSSTIETLARMYASDQANYVRAEQVLRGYKVMHVVRAAVRSKARQISKIDSVPGGGDALSLLRVKDELPDAPVDDHAVIPASWHIDGDEDGPRRYRLIKKIIRFRDGTHYAEKVGIAYNPIVISATMVDVNDGAAHLRISWKSRGGWRHKIVPRQKLVQARELLDALSGTHGFPANTNNAKDIIAYLADYEAFNEDVIPIQPMTNQMGWQGKNGSRGFVVGDVHIRESESQDKVQFVGNDVGDEQLARCLSRAGDFDEWKRAAKIASNFPSVEVALYAAIAPALLPILKAPNFTIDWSHKTSSGKTTTLSVAASVWGNPDSNGSDSYIASWDMTAVGFERRASVLSCLPLIVDDTKRAKAYRGESVVPSIVYEITNGQGRVRGSVKGTASTSYWRTVMLSTGEQRIIDFDKSGGTPARVVTLWGNPFGGSSHVVAQAIRRLRAGVLLNHGHAGPECVRWLLDNRENWQEMRDQHGALWDETREEMIEHTSGATMDMSVLDRVACNLASLRIAANVMHEAVDLPWELEDPIGELLPIIVPAAGAVDREAEALRTVVSWASSNRGKFIVNEKHRNDTEPLGGWLGYWEAAQYDGWDILAFFPTQLRDFLRRCGYEPTSIMRQWAESGWLVKAEKNRLTSGVNHLSGRPRMVVLKRDAVTGPGGLDGVNVDGQDGLPF